MRRIAIDANILVILYTIEARQDLSEAQLGELVQGRRGGDLVQRPLLRRLRQCFKNATCRMITVGGLVEADNLLDNPHRGWSKADAYRGRRTLEKFVDDHQVQVLSPSSTHHWSEPDFAEMFRHIGYSDALLIAAARDTACDILSDDRRRFPEFCSMNGVTCYSIEEIPDA
ncbi:MAG: hypothetical protein NTV70_24565 [Acidobacteria bacterium]|nr:hypothetical protein [Acidobacteriota bacterium]